MQFDTVKYRLKHEVDPESTIFAAVDLIESYNFKYWLSNGSLEFITFLEAVNEPHYASIMEEEPGIGKMVAFLKSTFFNPASLLDLDETGIEKKIEAASSMRDVLEAKTMVLTAYGEKTKLYEYIMNRKEGRWGKYDGIVIDKEGLTNRILQYIVSDNDPALMQSKIKFIYGQLPVRLSRGKFINWIEQALMLLRGVQASEMDDYCKMIADIFYPEGVKGYGEQFVPLYEAVNSLEKSLEPDLDEKDVQGLFDKVKAIGAYIEDAISLMLLTATMLNNMIALLYSLSKSSAGTNAQEAKAFMDLMTHIATLEQGDVIDKTVVEHLHAIEKTMEKSMEDLVKVDGLLDMLNNSYEDELKDCKLTEKTVVLNRVRELSSANYFLPLYEKDREDQVADDVYVRQKVLRFSELLTEVIDREDRALNRARIGNVLGMLNVIHNNTDAIRDYVGFSLNQCRDESELRATIHLIETEISQGND